MYRQHFSDENMLFITCISVWCGVDYFMLSHMCCRFLRRIHEGLSLWGSFTLTVPRGVKKIHDFSYVIPDWTAEIREPK